MKVCSNAKRKPRYWVEHEGEVLFESEDASKAIQWAIDNAGKIELNGVFEMKEPINMKSGRIIEGEKEKQTKKRDGCR